MNDRDLIDRLRSHSSDWMVPSPELRARVLATSVRPRQISWSDRAWFSRTWRLGMAAAALAFVALDFWAARVTTSLVRPAMVRNVEAEALADIVRGVGIPDDVASTLARRATSSSRTTSASAVTLAALVPGEN